MAHYFLNKEYFQHKPDFSSRSKQWELTFTTNLWKFGMLYKIIYYLLPRVSSNFRFFSATNPIWPQLQLYNNVNLPIYIALPSELHGNIDEYLITQEHLHTFQYNLKCIYTQNHPTNRWWQKVLYFRLLNYPTLLNSKFNITKYNFFSTNTRLQVPSLFNTRCQLYLTDINSFLFNKINFLTLNYNIKQNYFNILKLKKLLKTYKLNEVEKKHIVAEQNLRLFQLWYKYPFYSFVTNPKSVFLATYQQVKYLTTFLPKELIRFKKSVWFTRKALVKVPKKINKKSSKDLK
eukprot:TRINITY_DN358_c0_g1_i3.p1 TRINITY_DN358_c0_g1~~TRINITY_DN358_c0_g1_i3.p1  ORF type:complete len:290 (+),score=-94.89 TRINITY_DN358_c0_g1_i3:91-960(+)